MREPDANEYYLKQHEIAEVRAARERERQWSDACERVDDDDELLDLITNTNILYDDDGRDLFAMMRAVPRIRDWLRSRMYKHIDDLQ